MSHRIDIELTSQAGESWTWRAAGARQPKGNIEASMLYEGARVGDVVRAEAERELDGVRIVAVTPPRNARVEVARIELIEREAPVGISVQYADRPDRRGGGDRGRERGPRREGARPPREPRADGADRRPPRGDRPERATRPSRPERPQRDRPERQRPLASKQRRLQPGRAHRDALIDALSPERRPIADQLFRGGIPAVRQAIIDQNAQLRAAGQPEVPATALLSMADELLPQVRTADWLDRAAAALASSDDIALRDLRAVVTQADQAARDDASREMAAKLRAALNGRIDGERADWEGEIAASIDDSKLVRALRLAARVPDPGAKLSPEMSARLVASTNEALNPSTRPDVWAATIEAAADAPFRRDIVPTGLPDKPGESLLAVAANASNRIPALLKLLGLSMPPPPRAKAVPPPPPVRAPAPALTAPADVEVGAAAGEAESAPPQS